MPAQLSAFKVVSQCEYYTANAVSGRRHRRAHRRKALSGFSCRALPCGSQPAAPDFLLLKASLLAPWPAQVPGFCCTPGVTGGPMDCSQYYQPGEAPCQALPCAAHVCSVAQLAWPG